MALVVGFGPVVWLLPHGGGLAEVPSVAHAPGKGAFPGPRMAKAPGTPNALGPVSGREPGNATGPARAMAAQNVCPAGTRLLEGEHLDEVEHECTDQRGKNCFAFEHNRVSLGGDVTPIRVCMDLYEAPNQRGARPIVMKNALEAAAYCEERGKRLCSEAEWEFACEGPEHLPYVYGWEVQVKVCNSDKPWKPFSEQALRQGGMVANAEVSRLWQGEGSGSRQQCVSKDGIFDLMGNVEEWVSSRATRPFRAALKGGFWAKPWSTCRGTNDAHDVKFRFYEVGFRCCMSPPAKP